MLVAGYFFLIITLSAHGAVQFTPSPQFVEAAECGEVRAQVAALVTSGSPGATKMVVTRCVQEYVVDLN